MSEIIEQNKDQILKKLQDQEQNKDKAEKVKVVFIKENIYSVEGTKGNVSYYLNEKGDVILSIGWLLNFPESSNILKLLGITEKKVGDKRFLLDSDGKIVDQYSEKFFKIWQNVLFNLGYSYNHQSVSKRLSKEQIDKMYPHYINSGSFRIKDLQEYLKRGQIDFDYFNSKLPELEKMLPSQCLDVRFEKIYNKEGKPFSDLVTEAEIRGYYERGLIHKETAQQCSINIKKRDQIIEEYKKDKKEIHSEANINLKNIYSA